MVRTGKARFEFRNLAYTGTAAERVGDAMECAVRQSGNAFWAFHDRFLVERSSAASREQLIAFAGEQGLDTDSFTTCYDDPATRALLNQSINEARAIGVRFGPAVRVNGDNAGVTLESITAAVEAATP